MLRVRIPATGMSAALPELYGASSAIVSFVCVVRACQVYI